MKEFKIDKIEKLEDVFYAVLGGEPDNSAEMWEFLKNNKLGKLLYDTDIDRILHHDGYFTEETVDAVYAVLPLAIPLSEGRRYLMNSRTFRRLNQEKAELRNSTLVDISVSKALDVYQNYFNQKRGMIIELLYEHKIQTGEIKSSSVPEVSRNIAEQTPEKPEEKRRRQRSQYNLKHKQKAMQKPRNKISNDILFKSKER